VAANGSHGRLSGKQHNPGGQPQLILTLQTLWGRPVSKLTIFLKN